MEKAVPKYISMSTYKSDIDFRLADTKKRMLEESDAQPNKRHKSNNKDEETDCDENEDEIPSLSKIPAFV